jgi:hypothetical protein
MRVFLVAEFARSVPPYEPGVVDDQVRDAGDVDQAVDRNVQPAFVRHVGLQDVDRPTRLRQLLNDGPEVPRVA